MPNLKRYNQTSVLVAARERITFTFDNFERVYVSFSGGKDSTVMLHMVMDEAIKRGRKVGILIVDLEAQYRLTIEHVSATVEFYKDHIELYWACVPLLLRNDHWCKGLGMTQPKSEAYGKYLELKKAKKNAA